MSYDSEGDTREHVFEVAARLEAVCRELRRRGEHHDASKLGEIEKPLFDAVVPKLKDLVYGSDEYRDAVRALGPALKHHYENNSHHVEHYENGICGMDLLDLIEMYCDWAAASLRSRDGDMSKSIEINITRFGIDGQLGEILRNTWKRYGGLCGAPASNTVPNKVRAVGGTCHE
jgi:hypothetical protein